MSILRPDSQPLTRFEMGHGLRSGIVAGKRMADKKLRGIRGQNKSCHQRPIFCRQELALLHKEEQFSVVEPRKSWCNLI